MQDVQLLDQVLYAGGDQVVGQVVAVDLDDGGHDEQVAAGVEDVLELMGGVDDGGHAVSEDDAVTRMESHATIQDIQEQLNVVTMYIVYLVIFLPFLQPTLFISLFAS